LLWSLKSTETHSLWIFCAISIKFCLSDGRKPNLSFKILPNFAPKNFSRISVGVFGKIFSSHFWTKKTFQKLSLSLPQKLETVKQFVMIPFCLEKNNTQRKFLRAKRKFFSSQFFHGSRISNNFKDLIS